MGHYLLWLWGFVFLTVWVVFWGGIGWASTMGVGETVAVGFSVTVMVVLMLVAGFWLLFDWID